MEERTRVNVAVGLFVLIGVLALGYLSVKLGRVSILGGGGYAVTAEFPSVGGLKPGSTVEIAGVEIGRVESITLKDYQALVTLRINSGVKLQDRSEEHTSELQSRLHLVCRLLLEKKKNTKLR